MICHSPNPLGKKWDRHSEQQPGFDATKATEKWLWKANLPYFHFPHGAYNMNPRSEVLPQLRSNFSLSSTVTRCLPLHSTC